MSLYDYLGKAAGGNLGAKVNAYAQIRKQKYTKRAIENPGFSGEVFLYKEEFLEEFFKVQTIFV
jgi:hypothetical protein